MNPFSAGDGNSLAGDPTCEQVDADPLFKPTCIACLRSDRACPVCEVPHADPT